MVKKEKEKPVEWLVDCERFVGFVDIMGFKDLVARKSHEEVGQMLQEMTHLKEYSVNSLNAISKKAEKYQPLKDKVKTVAFSDSILFVSKDNDVFSLVAITAAMGFFQDETIRNALPTKGALSCGRMHADFKNSIFYGQPLIDSYLLEEQVYYYGIVLDHNIDRYLSFNKESLKDTIDDLENMYHNGPTCLKSGQILHQNLIFGEMEEGCLEKLYETVSGAPRKYVDNTIKMYNQMKQVAS